MKFSKENLKAVEDRFIEYENAIESGTGLMDDCRICDTVYARDSDVGFYYVHCDNCVLDKMTPENNCCTDKRTEALVRSKLDPKEDGVGYFHLCNVDALKARLKEMRDHVEEQLK